MIDSMLLFAFLFRPPDQNGCLLFETEIIEENDYSFEGNKGK